MRTSSKSAASLIAGMVLVVYFVIFLRQSRALWEADPSRDSGVSMFFFFLVAIIGPLLPGGAAIGFWILRKSTRPPVH